jgi:phosphate transport system permease protein
LWALKIIACSIVFVLCAIAFFLLLQSAPSIKAFGVKFLFSSNWDPVKEDFGALAVVVGTLLSSFIALAISAPISIGIAIFINELCRPKLGKFIGFLVEMLAAIPSVVYGLWGIFVFAPFFRDYIQPCIVKVLGSIPFFQAYPSGAGIFTAGIILAIMITPTISAISREVFRAIPNSQREAALGIGATKWEMIKIAVIKSSKAGVFGAIILGLGRALGETMAVTMVIGNRIEIPKTIFSPAQTMASIIANEYSEATNTLHVSALAEIGFVLFGVTFLVNAVARLIIWRVAAK